jgi:hypothetical protein
LFTPFFLSRFLTGKLSFGPQIFGFFFAVLAFMEFASAVEHLCQCYTTPKNKGISFAKNASISILQSAS